MSGEISPLLSFNLKFAGRDNNDVFKKIPRNFTAVRKFRGVWRHGSDR